MIDQQSSRSKEMVNYTRGVTSLPEIGMLASQHHFKVAEVGDRLTRRILDENG
jgi:hypothetical protein